MRGCRQGCERFALELVSCCRRLATHHHPPTSPRFNSLPPHPPSTSPPPPSPPCLPRNPIPPLQTVLPQQFHITHELSVRHLLGKQRVHIVEVDVLEDLVVHGLFDGEPLQPRLDEVADEVVVLVRHGLWLRAWSLRVVCVLHDLGRVHLVDEEAPWVGLADELSRVGVIVGVSARPNASKLLLNTKHNSYKILTSHAMTPKLQMSFFWRSTTSCLPTSGAMYMGVPTISTLRPWGGLEVSEN